MHCATMHKMWQKAYDMEGKERQWGSETQSMVNDIDG